MIQRPAKVISQSSRLGAPERSTTRSRRGREGSASARGESKSIKLHVSAVILRLASKPFS